MIGASTGLVGFGGGDDSGALGLSDWGAGGGEAALGGALANATGVAGVLGVEVGPCTALGGDAAALGSAGAALGSDGAARFPGLGVGPPHAKTLASRLQRMTRFMRVTLRAEGAIFNHMTHLLHDLVRRPF